MKTKTINQTGIIVKGTSCITLWDNSMGYIEMNPSFIPNGKITKTAILNAVNDAKYGCQFISQADIDIYIKYDNGSEEYDRTIYAIEPIHTKLFGKRGI